MGDLWGGENREATGAGRGGRGNALGGEEAAVGFTKLQGFNPLRFGA